MIPSSYKPINGTESPPRASTDNNDTAQPTTQRHKRVLQRIKSIDRGFVVSKLFYFFFYTALGALFPFFGLYYKQLWLSAGQIGLLLALRPTVKLVCLPLWKMITDKYSRPKIVYFISIFGWLFGYFGQTFVYINDVPCYGLKPSSGVWKNATVLNGSLPLKTRDFVLEKKGGFGPKLYNSLKNVQKSFYKEKEMDTDSGKITVHGERGGVSIDSREGKQSQMNEQARPEFDSSERKKNSRNLENMKVSYNKGKTQAKILDDTKRKSGRIGSYQVRHIHLLNTEQRTDINKHKSFENVPVEFKENHVYDFDVKALKKGTMDEVAKLNELSSDEAEIPLGPFQHTFSKSPKPANDFRVKFNFWIFRTLVVIVILTEIITAPTPMLADSAAIQSIADTDSKYGTQRLFGSIGLALAAILVATWVSHSSFCHYSDTINYLPCFYIFMLAMLVTVFVSLFFKFEKSEQEGESVGFLEGLKIFKTPRHGFFLFTIFVLGFSHSLQISFLFWFLQDIGGTPVLFAIIILVYCFSEVVMYFVSGYVIEAIGHQGTICLAIACYTARFLMYGSLKDPWLVIPMEMVQGVTYGGVWTVTGVYIKAPEG